MKCLEIEWQGKVWSLRRLPAHIKLTDPDATLIAARSLVWLTVRTVAAVALLAVVYAVVQT